MNDKGLYLLKGRFTMVQNLLCEGHFVALQNPSKLDDYISTLL